MPLARARPALRSSLAGALGLLIGCAGGSSPRVADPVPVPEPPPVSGPTPNLPPAPRQPIVPASLAAARGWLPLSTTGVPLFLGEHPSWDGRGILIGILDSGIDPGAPGLQATSLGRPKILDLRDFSGEGRIELSPSVPEGDSVRIGGRSLRGFGRVRGIATAGPWYAGALIERGLGEPAASDVNDNGTDADTLAVIVAKASDGWVLFADTDGDGSLGNERPVHDYLVARETFGWHRGGEPPPLMIAANFSAGGAGPALDLFFDNSAHGTHVSGIAAGHDIGGVAGFDGVAPGAQLLGLKISRNDFGGITTTGSILAAMDYGIRFARGRGIPLVFNMSFGVGNEREGAARIDAMIDSVLTANPDVVFVTSAGNDGPGASTVGFPGSARRAITVGGTDPWALTEAGVRGGRPAPDHLAFFSSRGGELAKPDLVAPGTAYSTVPRWNTGDEFKGGTSMASPHVAGLAALLLSAAVQERRSVTADDLRRALVGSAAPLAGGGPIDQGAGLPSLLYAWPMLRGPAPPAEFDVEVLGGAGVTAAFRIAPGAIDSVVKFVLRRRGGAAPVDLVLKSTVPWLRPPETVRLAGSIDTITLVQRPPAGPGTWSGAVQATATGVAGPLFTLISTVVVPDATRALAVRTVAMLEPGAARRVVFAVDSGRPFRVRSSSGSRLEKIVAALFQPGGAPLQGEGVLPGGPDSLAAVHQVDGRDARAGYYETVAVAGDGAATATIAIDHAPVTLALAARGADSLSATLVSRIDSAVAGRFNMGLAGAEQSFELGGIGGADVSRQLAIPGWVHRVAIDLELDREQWPRFTDFGFTLKSLDGRILAKEPANYHRTRLAETLPPRASDDELLLVLAPGFAEPGSRESWRGRVTIRLYAQTPVVVPHTPGEEFALSPGSTREWRARIDATPWPLPAGFRPLGVFMVESAGLSWSWELPAGAGKTP